MRKLRPAGRRSVGASRGISHGAQHQPPHSHPTTPPAQLTSVCWRAPGGSCSRFTRPPAGRTGRLGRLGGWVGGWQARAGRQWVGKQARDELGSPDPPQGPCPEPRCRQTSLSPAPSQRLPSRELRRCQSFHRRSASPASSQPRPSLPQDSGSSPEPPSQVRCRHTSPVTAPPERLPSHEPRHCHSCHSHNSPTAPPQPAAPHLWPAQWSARCCRPCQ